MLNQAFTPPSPITERLPAHARWISVLTTFARQLRGILTVRLMLTFFRQYPARCSIVIFCLLFASLAEGLGVSTLLPLLRLATGEKSVSGDQDTVTELITTTFDWVHLEPTALAMLTVIFLGLTLKAILTLLAYRQVGYVVAQIATNLRLALLKALSASRWEYFLNQQPGRLANATATEANRSGTAFRDGADAISMLIQAMTYTAIAFMVHPKLALGVVVIAPLIFGVLGALVRMARKAGRRQQYRFSSLLALLTDSLQSIKPLKAMAREGQTGQMLAHDTHKLNRALRKEVLSREALKAIQQWAVGLTLVLGIYVALAHLNMELSGMTVFTVVIARMLTVLSKMQRKYQRLTVSEPFYWALQDSIHEAESQREINRGRLEPTLNVAIQLESVTFAYNGQPVLERIDMHLPAGRLTAIIGTSGAGKTTLFDLVIGLLQPTDGRILVDGVPLSEIDLRKWRGMIGYVPQETVLIHDSILHNVTVGDPHLTEADAVKALKQAEAWDFVQAMEDGIHTLVGERGARLSGGQRQRILIARAIVHQPRLLILDEATNALDLETEAEICTTLSHLKGEMTLLAISHQAGITRAADTIYRLGGGQVVTVEDPQQNASSG